MKAVVHDRYGPPEVLQVRDVSQPVPDADEVLVRVHASTVTRTDCGVRSARPFFVRLFTGLIRPKQPIAGIEFAGEVASVGKAVTAFAPGDRVFGVKSGSNAEYICVKERGAIARMPAVLSFEQAAALADGGCSALSTLRQAGLQAGQRVVVYGASGSIGTAAVQVAKHQGAHVTAVCGPNAARARPFSRRRRGSRLHARGLRGRRREVRPRLRRGRQELVPSLSASGEP